MILTASLLALAMVGCDAPAPPPAALAGWTRRTLASRAPLRAGQGVDVALDTVGRVRFAVTPGRAAPAGSFGATIALRIERGGSFRVALGTAAWIDLIADGQAIASSGHAHGPACTGIRKLVDFTLAPGDYQIQISGSAEPRTGLLVTEIR